MLTTDSHPRPTFRFAPSPNGYLHLGHALSALVGFAWARRVGGRFLVRIEDIDLGRVRPAFIDAILEDLAWLGITWEEPALRQSTRFGAYEAARARLEALGVLYPCWATRSDIAAATASGPARLDPDGAPLYPGLWRRGGRPLPPPPDGVQPALRLDMAQALRIAAEKLGTERLGFTELDDAGEARPIEAHPERWGDCVVIRRDVPASYHLAVVVDDADQGVTHVTRGADLFAATDLQRLLQVLLDLPEPLYHHHRLVTDGAGRKLSKSAADTSLRELREKGATARDIRSLIELAEEN